MAASKSEGILCSPDPIGYIHDLSSRIKLQIQTWQHKVLNEQI